jgi:hypothetical protein
MSPLFEIKVTKGEDGYHIEVVGERLYGAGPTMREAFIMLGEAWDVRAQKGERGDE